MEKLPEQLHHSQRSIVNRNEYSPSSFEKLDSVLRFSKAVATIEEDILKSPTVSPGKVTLGSVLHRQLRSRLSETSLLPESIPERVSVIVHTPTGNLKTSTPQNSPGSTSIDIPKSCNSLGSLSIYTPRSHSPCCLDISSIEGDVFIPSESLNSLDPISRPRKSSPKVMESPENKVSRLVANIHRLIRNFTDNEVTKETIRNGEYKEKLIKVDNLCSDLVETIELFILNQVSPDEKLIWENKVKETEAIVKDYMNRLRSILRNLH